MKRMRYLKSLDQIPHFKSESEEAEFWATHSLMDLWDQLEPVELEVLPKARRLYPAPQSEEAGDSST